MNLLILTNNPHRASFRQRVGIHLDTLRANHVDSEVVQLPPGFLARQKLFRRAADFDGILLHKKRLNAIDVLSLRRYGRKVIYDFDDAVMYSDRNPERYSRSRFVRFRKVVKLADVVIAGNSYLAEHAGRFNSNVEILPTGLDVKAYQTHNVAKNDGKIRLVWIGSQSTLKYLAEIKPALEEIGARFDNVVLRIICDKFFSLHNMEVEKQQWSEKTQVSDLSGCDIGLAPLPDNPFTRGKCGFKILQYAAAGLPVIASPVGVNAQYVSNGITGFHAANIPQWIERMASLIENEQLRKNMSLETRRPIERFDISVIGKRLLDTIKNCIDQNVHSKPVEGP
ncbi:MAG: glycosyltransferase family 4 protein [Sedimentisphaerales bacterium]